MVSSPYTARSALEAKLLALVKQGAVDIGSQPQTNGTRRFCMV
jgi:hypothetical protein